MKVVLLDKNYSSEELNDVGRDVDECFGYGDIEIDEHGFSKGSYKITVVYTEDD
jgi:hypothetical protein